MKPTTLQKTLDLQTGLYLIRYDSAEDAGHPPKVSLSADPRNAPSVEFLLPPHVEEPIMWSPGANVVVRLSAPARLQVEVTARSSGGSVGARIQSAQLSTDPLGLAALEEQPIDFAGLRLLGHLSGRGDTLVGLGEWLGGPMAPTRIEGVGIDWVGRPQNFGLKYSVRVGGGAEGRATEYVEAGGFSGTRGRALPLVGATFEVFGPAAQNHELIADAIFLGSPQMKVSGQRVVLSGPTGREPLVGLRLQVVSMKQAAAQNVIPSPAAHPMAPQLTDRASKSGTKSGNRVRVFRSGRSAK